MGQLRFSPGSANSKLKKLEKLTGRKVYSFSLLSGHSCPFADKCQSRAVEDDNGKRHILDGMHTEFRCFSASQEVMYDGVYRQRRDNFDVVRSIRNLKELTNCIAASVPNKAEIVRVHVAGDFYNPRYFVAWMRAAALFPDKLFYAYTKSLAYWLRHADEVPSNFSLTASYGGLGDELIAKHGLRYSQVVGSEDEAASIGLVVDNDDSHAALPDYRDTSFALVVHGTQPKGGKYSQVVNARRHGKTVNA